MLSCFVVYPFVEVHSTLIQFYNVEFGQSSIVAALEAVKVILCISSPVIKCRLMTLDRYVKLLVFLLVQEQQKCYWGMSLKLQEARIRNNRQSDHLFILGHPTSC